MTLSVSLSISDDMSDMKKLRSTLIAQTVLLVLFRKDSSVSIEQRENLFRCLNARFQGSIDSGIISSVCRFTSEENSLNLKENPFNDLRRDWRLSTRILFAFGKGGKVREDTKSSNYSQHSKPVIITRAEREETATRS